MSDKLTLHQLESFLWQGKNQNQLRDEDVEKVISTLDNYTDEKRYSKVVEMDEIRENDFNLNIRRYADTSPPPEQFDVKAILHGGIPVSEIEDEYIQETLQGMEVSCVFEPKEEGYYQFKPEIESKDQIKALLPNDDQAIIDQIERWWDKYQVSLHQLNKQTKETEDEMWKHLKELGYE